MAKFPGWIDAKQTGYGPSGACNESCDGKAHIHLSLRVKRFYWLRPSFWSYLWTYRHAR